MQFQNQRMERFVPMFLDIPINISLVCHHTFTALFKQCRRIAAGAASYNNSDCGILDSVVNVVECFFGKR